MKKEKLFVVILAVAFMAFSAAPVWADKGEGCKMCKLGEKKCDKNGKDGYGESTKDKFFDKAHFYLDKKDDLGLSEEQTGKIKSLKLALKKDIITSDAEIELVALDIKAKLYESKIDPAAVNVLIDKKYDLKKAVAKKTVAAFAELKTVLTEEQKGKAKELWNKKPTCDIRS